MATLLLCPLVRRCIRFSLSLKRECSPSFRFTSPPLLTTCRLAGNHPYVHLVGVGAVFLRLGQSSIEPEESNLRAVPHLKVHPLAALHNEWEKRK